jgi:hypothetical protein
MIHRQVNYIAERNPRSLDDIIITLPVSEDNADLRASIEAYRSELNQDPAVKGVSVSSFLPTNIRSGDTPVWDGKAEDEWILFHNLRTDYEFFKLYGIPVLQGRSFSPEFPSDYERAFIVNETAVQVMQMEEPIGKRFGYPDQEGVIIGVVKDFHFVPMHQRIKPLAIHLNPDRMRHIAVKVDPQHLIRVIHHIERAWKKISPGFAFSYSFIDDSVEALYRSEHRLDRSLTWFAYIALFLASLGLFGLAMFSVERRMKEIGVRKVLGAKIFNIVALISKDFTKSILLANCIALPLAAFVVHRWLQGFAYRANLSLSIFIVTVLISIGTAGLTVVYQTVKAAISNPVDSLRYE